MANIFPPKVRKFFGRICQWSWCGSSCATILCCWRKCIYREVFPLEDFYQETTEQEWKVLKSHTTTKHDVNKKKSQLTAEDMLFMQTNVLSSIPECFDLEAPRAPIRPRDGDKESRPPKGDFVKRKSSNESDVRNGVQTKPYSLGGYSLRDERRKARENQEQELKKRKSESECRNDEYGTSPTSSDSRESRDKSSDDVKHEPSNENGNSFTYQKMCSKIKFKSKTKVRKKRSNSAPPLRRSANVDEELTSYTEYRHEETTISFASYVKKRTPTLSLNKKTKSKPKLKKLRRTEAMSNIDLCGFSDLSEDLHVASDNNVTFNPIFQDDERVENRSNDMNHMMASRDDHVEVENDELNKQENNDVISNHVKKPPLVRSDHVEEFETRDVFEDVDDSGVTDHVDQDDSSHVSFREPIITFDTTYIRRDLYIIDEEPENE